MSNELLNAYLAWYSLSLSPTIYFILVVSEKLHMIGLALAHYHHAAAAIISKKIPSFFTNRESKKKFLKIFTYAFQNLNQILLSNFLSNNAL